MFSSISMNRMILLLITISALVACTTGTPPQTPTAVPTPTAEPTAATIPSTYHGVALPGGGGTLSQDSPPPTWLIVSDKAVLATQGSFLWGGSHADVIPPQEIPDLATANLPADAQAVIVIGIESFKQFQATVRPWTEEHPGQFFDPSSGRQLKAEGKREGDVIVFTLEPIGDAGDQLLAISITFAGVHEGESASYTWRLNPVLATPTPRTESGSTANWQTYTNTKYNFTMKYPPGWQYLEVPTPTYPAENDVVWFSHASWPPPNTDARPDLALIMTEQDPSPNWQPQYFNDYKTEPFKLGNVSATRISGTNKESLYPELVVIAKMGGFYVQALPNQSPESLKYFEQILSTFKFLD